MNDLVENPFGSVAKRQSSGVSQVEQRELAEVQAAVIMAKRFPRDQIAAVDRIINAFSRPALAESSQYQYSKGGSDVSGPSIRAAEAIAQQWGNIEFGFKELARGVGADGVPYSEVLAYAWDVETLARKPLQFIVRHWRDRKNGGGYQITEERDIYELIANMAQRRVRACLLSLIPGDVTEAAMKQADVTLKTNADTSMEAMQKMLDAFANFGVTKEQIEARIQRRIDAIQPAQVVSMKKIYASLRDGMSTPADWFDGASASEVKQPKELPAYPEEKLDNDIKAIESGKKKAAQVISMLSSKYALTDKQKTALTNAEKPKEADGNAIAPESDVTGIRIKCTEYAISEGEVCKHLGVETLDGITIAKAAEAIAFLNNPAGE